jgi:cysteine desulfurase
VPQAKVNGSPKKRLPNNVHVTLPGQDNERLVYELEARGVLAAAGSACSASSGEPSHVLKALGMADDDARASLRFTMGRASDEAAVRKSVDVLAAIVTGK